jgi:hypothetical protein
LLDFERNFAKLHKQDLHIHTNNAQGSLVVFSKFCKRLSRSELDNFHALE